MLDGVVKPCIGNVLIPSIISRKQKRIFCALIVSVLFAGSPAIAAEDDYLKALESEADDTGTLITKPSNNPQTGTAGAENNKVKENFEKHLEFELPSTYKFYTKLNPNDQNKVVRHYIEENKMSAASKLIFDLYFESNK
jgi:hypothetical protein